MLSAGVVTIAMSSVEKRAPRAGMKKVWSVSEAAGAERLRPPVTDSDLATGGVGEADPESESLFDTVPARTKSATAATRSKHRR